LYVVRLAFRLGGETFVRSTRTGEGDRAMGASRGPISEQEEITWLIHQTS